MHRYSRLAFALTAGLLSFVAAAPSRAADFYVSPSGNDALSGLSPGSGAWSTITRVNAQSFSAGDRIFFEGGQTFSGSLTFGADDTGSAAQPITVSSYGTGRATISAGTGKGIFVYNTAGFAISELCLTGTWSATTQSGNTTSGLEFFTDLPGATKLDFVHVDNVEVAGFKDYGIAFGGYPADKSKSGWTNVQITNCLVHDNGIAGITSYGYHDRTATAYANENIVVRDCNVHSNRGLTGVTTRHTGHGIWLGDLNGATIERCVAYNNGELNARTNGGPCGIWVYDCNAVLMQFNESHSNKSGGTTPDGGGFDFDGGTTNSIMQYNYSHGNHGAGFLMYQYSSARPLLGGNVIRFNISENDGRKGSYSGIFVGGGSAVQNNHIHNNTIYVTPAPSGTPSAFKSFGVGLGNTVRNNILMTTGGVRLIESTSTTNTTAHLLFQGNAYWSSGAAFSIRWGASTYTTLAAWRTAIAQEKIGTADTGLAVNPLLKNPGSGGTIGNPALLTQLDAYRLSPTSPMINSGRDLLALFGLVPGARDFFANTLPQGGAYDIGAHELGAPTVTVIAAATPNPATRGSATLSVTGTDEAGEANLFYTWTSTGTLPAPVTIGANGTNAAKNTSATFSKAGAYSFAVTITNAAGFSTASSVAVTVNQTFEFWIAEHGLAGNNALPDADPYRIGIGNLLAYALGIEPTAGNARSGLPTVAIQGNLLTLSYEAPRSDVTYLPEWSFGISEWTTAGISISSNGTARAASIPIGTDASKFLRLRVTR